MVSAHPAAISRAVKDVAACESCAPDASEIPFDWILADVLGKRGPYEFVMAETARCPACSAPITEKTLVEPTGGVEADAVA
jgi:hypothetical protein